MAACRQCHTELASIGCARCSPRPTTAQLDDIERDPRWQRAPSHRVGSQRGKMLFWIGGIVGGLLLIMLPSYWDAVEQGDTSGKPLVIGAAIVAGLALLGGAAFTMRKLQHRAAIVLTTTFHVWRDSRGRTSQSYHVHAFTRGGPVSLVAESEQVRALSPGDALIVFARGGYLDDVWPVVIATAPAPATATATAPATALAPAAGTGTGTGASSPDPVTLLASLSPTELARAEAVRVVRPWSHYAQQLATAAFGVFVLLLPLLAGGDGSDSVDGPEAYAERSRIISIVTTLLGLGILGLSAFLALRKRRQPLDAIVALVTGRREVRAGSSLLARIEVIERSGRSRELAATRDVMARVLVGEPYVLWSLDGKVLQVERVAR